MPRSLFTIGKLPEISVDVVYIDPVKSKKAAKLINDMPDIEIRAYKKACTNFGKMLSRYIRKCISTHTPPNGVNWEPLSPDYIKNYDTKGFWELSGQMLRSIRLRQYQTSYYVGPAPEEKAIDPVNRYGRARASKLTLIQLARILENPGPNSEYLVARPLFKPSFKAVGGTSRLKKYLIANLRRELKPYL